MKETKEESSKLYFDFSAGLRIKDAPEIHDLITKITNIAPSHVHLKGDYKKETLNRKWDNDIWILESPLDKTEDLTKHLIWLTNMIEPHINFFQEIINKGISVDIFCGFRSNCDHSGFLIESKALEIVTKLKITFHVSVIIT